LGPAFFYGQPVANGGVPVYAIVRQYYDAWNTIDVVYHTFYPYNRGKNVCIGQCLSFDQHQVRPCELTNISIGSIQKDYDGQGELSGQFREFRQSRGRLGARNTPLSSKCSVTRIPDLQNKTMSSFLIRCIPFQCQERKTTDIVPVGAQLRSLLLLERNERLFPIGQKRIAKTKGIVSLKKSKPAGGFNFIVWKKSMTGGSART